jgi:CRP/FNR family transcriptional regulator
MNPKLRLIMGKHRCPHCAFRKFFIGAGVDCQSLDDIGDAATQTYGPYKAGEVIYRTGDACDSLYVVQSGSVKIEMATEEGGAHVSGFYLTGEMFGSDGISKKVFPSDAIALERTTVCILNLSKWTRLCELYPSMQAALVSELADIILHKNNEMMLLHHYQAKDRILIFLRNLLERVRTRRGQSVQEIPLSMSKTDIARYLCVTPETLSRRLKYLEKTGVICNHGRTIEILEEEGLRKGVVA